MRIFAALAAVALVLSACGSRETLQPAPGAALPPKPATATATPTADQLLTSPAEARPDRSDELLKRSEERPDDRFNLPPG